MAPKGLSSSMSSGIGSGQLLSLFEQLEAFQRPQPLSITVTWHGVGGISSDCDQMIGTIK